MIEKEKFTRVREGLEKKGGLNQGPSTPPPPPPQKLPPKSQTGDLDKAEVAISKSEYERIHEWYENGMAQGAQTAFTAGPGRNLARLMEMERNENAVLKKRVEDLGRERDLWKSRCSKDVVELGVSLEKMRLLSDVVRQERDEMKEKNRTLQGAVHRTDTALKSMRAERDEEKRKALSWGEHARESQKAARGLEEKLAQQSIIIEKKDEALNGPIRCKGGCCLCSCDKKYISEALTLKDPCLDVLAKRDQKTEDRVWEEARRGLGVCSKHMGERIRSCDACWTRLHRHIPFAGGGIYSHPGRIKVERCSCGKDEMHLNPDGCQRGGKG